MGIIEINVPLEDEGIKGILLNGRMIDVAGAIKATLNVLPLEPVRLSVEYDPMLVGGTIQHSADVKEG